MADHSDCSYFKTRDQQQLTGTVAERTGEGVPVLVINGDTGIKMMECRDRQHEPTLVSDSTTYRK